MKAQRTIPVIISNDPDLQTTLYSFHQVKRDISESCFNNGKPLNAIKLHKKVYQDIKGRLNAQMLCSVIRAAAGAYSSAKSNKQEIKKPFEFKRPSALFLVGPRGRDASFLKDGIVSISTVNGRKKIGYKIPKKFESVFEKAVRIDSLTLVDRNGILKAYLTISLEFPDPTGSRPVGIDLNATNALVASDSDGKIFFASGLRTRIKNTRTRKTRRRLQQKLSEKKAQRKSSRSTRRILKRLSRKQRNRTLNFCRVTARNLVCWAGANSVLVFEARLKNLKVSKKSHQRKGTRRKPSRWNRGLMRRCIENVAQTAGIPCDETNPYRTSQDCSRCGLDGVRSHHSFSCPHCGYSEHADINAAINIRQRFTVLRSSGLSVNQP